MSDYKNKEDKLSVHIDSLYRQHRKLDDQIKKEFDKFAAESTIRELKHKKLALKEEIVRLEKELGKL
mgnify:CR=1 FL=1|jgi:hypothetical protein